MNYGTNTLIIGPPGTGKTYSARTLVEAGLETLVVFTEPGMETISDVPCSKGLHYTYIAPATPSFESMIKAAQEINRLPFDMLTKKEGINKKEYQQLVQFYTALHAFKCDRCGKEFQDAETFTPDMALVIDGLSGLATMCMDLVVGSKPVKSLANWGVAMDQMERLLTKITCDCSAHVVVLAHVEMERDEVSGRVEGMPSALGRKLSPKIPRVFSDVVLSVRDGKEFYWSTETNNIATKTRNLPIQAKIPPSFVPLIQTWRKHHPEDKDV